MTDQLPRAAFPRAMRILADSGAVRHVVFSTTDPEFRWIDVIAPDRPTLHSLMTELGIPSWIAEDCLDPRALPKYERHGSVWLILVGLFVGVVRWFSTRGWLR